jgi:hypothetical protein
MKYPCTNHDDKVAFVERNGVNLCRECYYKAIGKLELFNKHMRGKEHAST